MVEMTVRYAGDFHCELTHKPSGAGFSTDAPKDNQGRGAAFSPTDLLGASLASCILTTMAISARLKLNIGLGEMSAVVTKEMTSEPPRKVKRLSTVVTMPLGLDEHQRKSLEATAHHCPVHLSLHPDIELPIQFIYRD